MIISKGAQRHETRAPLRVIQREPPVARALVARQPGVVVQQGLLPAAWRVAQTNQCRF